MRGNDEILACSELYKSFGLTAAVNNINLSINKGDIIGLVGENGAGKTTLIKLIAGEYKPDKGNIIYKGSEIKWEHSNQALKNGIGLVHQTPLLVSDLSGVDNIYLGQEFTQNGLINDSEAFEKAKELIKQYPLYTEGILEKKVREMTSGEKEVIEILKAFSYNPEILILDEPTASLPKRETETLINLLKDLNANKQLTIILISHKLEETFDICNKIVVLRNGKNVGTVDKSQFNKNLIIKMMINEELSTFYPEKGQTVGKPIFEVKNLSSDFIKNISFNVRAGEIVGFYGLMGAGMTEMAETVFGIRRIEKGNIFLNDDKIDKPKISEMIDKGVYLIPSDRHKYSIFKNFSIKENITIVHLRYFLKGLFIKQKKEKEMSIEKAKPFEIKYANINQKMNELSGGNQQKVVVARWLIRDCKILIVDDPTVGIDVGAKHDIYLTMRKLTQMGVGIIFISSDMAEMLGIADKIYTMRDGRITAELTYEQLTQENILKNIL